MEITSNEGPMKTSNNNREPHGNVVVFGPWAFWLDPTEPLGEQFMAAPVDLSNGQINFQERHKVDAYNLTGEQATFMFSALDAIYGAAE